MDTKRAPSFAHYSKPPRPKSAAELLMEMDDETESDSESNPSIPGAPSDLQIGQHVSQNHPEGSSAAGQVTSSKINGHNTLTGTIEKPKGRGQGRKEGYRFKCWLCDFNRKSKHEISRHFKSGAHPGVEYNMSLIQEYQASEDAASSPATTTFTSNGHATPSPSLNGAEDSNQASGIKLRLRPRKSTPPPGKCSTPATVSGDIRHKAGDANPPVPLQAATPDKDILQPRPHKRNRISEPTTRADNPSTTRELRSHKKRKMADSHQPEPDQENSRKRKFDFEPATEADIARLLPKTYDPDIANLVEGHQNRKKQKTSDEAITTTTTTKPSAEMKFLTFDQYCAAFSSRFPADPHSKKSECQLLRERLLSRISPDTRDEMSERYGGKSESLVAYAGAISDLDDSHLYIDDLRRDGQRTQKLADGLRTRLDMAVIGLRVGREKVEAGRVYAEGLERAMDEMTELYVAEVKKERERLEASERRNGELEARNRELEEVLRERMLGDIRRHAAGSGS